MKEVFMDCVYQGDLSEVEKQKREKLKLKKPQVYKKVMGYAEKVKRGESIAILQFQYDYRCNFRCEHCCTSKMQKKDRYFTLDDVKELSRQADELGLAHFTITGGSRYYFQILTIW